MGTKEAIQQNLCLLMDANKTKNVELARALGVSKAAVTNWRNGRNSIDMDYVPAICRFFNVSVDEFLNVGTRKALSPEEHELIDKLRSVSSDGKQRIIEYVKLIAKEFPGDTGND